MSRIAESSAITPPPAEAQASIAAEPIVAVHIATPAVAGFVAARLPACIRARSAASITAATRGDFLHAADQASAGDSMAAEVSMAVEVTSAEVTDEHGAPITVK